MDNNRDKAMPVLKYEWASASLKGKDPLPLCPKCGGAIYQNEYKYCPWCGQRIDTSTWAL